MSSRAPRPSWTNLPPLDDPPATVLDWLATHFSRIDRATWIRRMDEGLVTDAEGRPLGIDAPYVRHLRVAYFREVENEPPPIGEVGMIHFDDHLVVVDKPPFMPVTPGGGTVRGCLLYQVEDQLGLEGLAPVHRLDRATSGLVMLARRQDERSAYAGLFARHQIERTYVGLARVPVLPESREWIVESRIVKGTPFFLMREIEGTSNAFTRIELESWQDGWGHFRLHPESGKTHQLRLHMLRLGWPIHGDRFYPKLQPKALDDPAAPMLLVAKRLAFRDPLTGEDRIFESRLDPRKPLEPGRFSEILSVSHRHQAPDQPQSEKTDDG